MRAFRRMITSHDIKSLIHAGNEDTSTPQAVLDYLKTRNGKTLTKRDLPALRAIVPSARIHIIAHMTHIEWNDHGRILIAHGSGAPTIDAEWIESHNAHCFEAARERNEKRATALKDASTHQTCAHLVNLINDSQAALNELIGHDGPLYTERCEIEKLIDRT